MVQWYAQNKIVCAAGWFSQQEPSISDGQYKNINEQIKKIITQIKQPCILQLILIFISFIFPLLILYRIDPGSFEFLWKGRAPYLLFLWLLFLETGLGWKKVINKKIKFWTKKTILVALMFVLPTVYSLGLNFGFKEGILEIGKVVGVPFEQFGDWY